MRIKVFPSEQHIEDDMKVNVKQINQINNNNNNNNNYYYYYYYYYY